MLTPYLKKFWKYRELIVELVKRDLKIKYRGSCLGYLWSLLNPLLMMIVISAVFSHIFRFDIPNFPIYLLAGQILYSYFNEATTFSMNSLLNGSGLIRKVAVPKYIFPLTRTISSFVTLLFSLVAIVVMLFITKTELSWTILLFPFPLIYLFLFSLGFSLILSVLAVYYRDIMHLYGVLLTAWMYFTPIFYPVDMLPEIGQRLMVFNPLYHYIQMFRDVIMYQYVPSAQSHLICVAFSLASLCFGLLFFKTKQDELVIYL